MERKRLSIDLEEEDHRKFKAKVSLEGKKMVDKIVEWIRKYIRDKKN